MKETAVILFCDAAAEGRRKRIPRAFLKALHLHVHRRLDRPAHFDLFAASELAPREQTATLAEQISLCIRAAFRRGYRAVIIAAADVPALAPAHLIGAANEVRAGGAAISRSGDGGFSLAAFGSEPAIDWGRIALHTARAAADLAGALIATGCEVRFLESLDDVDDAAGAGALVLRFSTTVARSLLALLAARVSPAPIRTPASLRDRQTPALRGPPLLACRSLCR